VAIDVTKRQADRLRVLAALFYATDGIEGQIVRLVPTIQEQLELSDQELQAACSYLVGEGLISAVAPIAESDMYFFAELTHRGVIAMEESLKDPDRPTTLFPPAVSIISINNSTLVNSPIQNGSNGGQQTNEQTPGERL
jgi:hypothetical protein